MNGKGALPRTGRVQLKRPAPVGQGQRLVIEDGIEQRARASGANPGIGGCFTLAQAQSVGDGPVGAVQLAQPAEMIEATARVEPQARCKVFERVGDIESVG